MTPAEYQLFLVRHPRLFHMTAAGAWESVRRHGLLSTTALLDRAAPGGPNRTQIEGERRNASVRVALDGGFVADIRDQKPMNDERLRRVLPGDVTPSDWRRHLNRMVFFWVSEKRLRDLSKARSYRGSVHDVLVLDTRRLVESLRAKIWLCPINSGSTLFTPVPRSYETFRRIDDYDYQGRSRKRGTADAVVELCVDHAIPDVAPYLIERWSMKAGEIVSVAN